MKRFAYITLIFMVFLLSLSCSLTAQEVKRPVPAPNVIAPATSEMQRPEFWIARVKGNSDKVIMTPAQISELLEKNRKRPLDTQDFKGNPYSIRGIVNQKDIIGVQFYIEDPLLLVSMTGDSLRTRFQRARNYVERGKWFDRRHIPYTDDMKRELLDATNESAIPDRIEPAYGVLVRHTLNRVMPTHEAAFWGQFDYQDVLQSTSLETGMPVAVLHSSMDGDWLYVKSELSFGWVPSINVAEGSKKDIRRFAEPENFIVAIAHKVPVYSDSDCSCFLTDIYMGARLPLDKKTESGYKVKVPYRKGNGSLETVRGWVKPDADISVGYQPFTQRNVLDTVFRLLYRPYGWADSNHERDCCGTMRTVLKTVGIITPRWTTHELHSTDHVTVFPKGTPKEVKYDFLSTCEPGITLCGFTGHVVMYLGEVDGVHYVIHQSGYNYYDEAGTEYRVGRVIVNDTELQGGSNIDRFTEISTFKP